MPPNAFTDSPTHAPSLPPLVVPGEGGWLLGSYDTDELDALAAAARIVLELDEVDGA